MGIGCSGVATIVERDMQRVCVTIIIVRQRRDMSKLDPSKKIVRMNNPCELNWIRNKTNNGATCTNIETGSQNNVLLELKNMHVNDIKEFTCLFFS